MENFKISDINLLTKTVLIGLPGVGKSALSNELCRIVKQETGFVLENVSSDLRLREVRKDVNNPVVRKFMQEHNIPPEDFPLLIQTNNFMHKYGEQTFRDLESDVIVDMLERGEFEGKIPNLGGKAMLHEKTARAFKQKGYKIIYLKMTVKEIAEHIVQDFEAANDGATITRSNINGPISDALRQSDPEYADVSPSKFVLNRISKMQKTIKADSLSTAIKKAMLSRQRKLYRYEQRFKLRDDIAFKVMSRFDTERGTLYQKVAEQTLNRTSDIHQDALAIHSLIRQSQTSYLLNKVSHTLE